MDLRLPVLLSLLLISLFPRPLSAQDQPPICPADEMAVMAPFCEEACIICDIDGFSGRNGRDEDFFLPEDFCTRQAHNGKWIGFIAGSEDLRIELAVSNCEMDTGLEIGIYEATDCSNPVSVGSCFGAMTSIGPGESEIFENLVPLIVGQYYYIVMDGGRDDVCDWQFTVIEGTTEVAPLTVSGPISGPFFVCPNIPVSYSTEVELGAAAFSWTVDGQEVATGQTPEITWNTEGEFELCVIASNACDQAAPFCTSVTVEIPQATVIDTIICSNQALVFSDSTLTESGEYFFDFTATTGCDSNFVINLTVIESQEETLTLNICTDDSFEINGETFDETGSFQQVLLNRFGCDSTLNLNLTFIECNITAGFGVTNVRCAGNDDGEISFNVLTGTPPFTYLAADLVGTAVASGSITGLNENIDLTGIMAGQYQVTILDEFSNDTRILNLVVTEPDPLTVVLTTSDFNGFPVSCFGFSDGEISLTPGGGTAPYVADWNNNTSGLVVNNLSAGTYAYVLTDANNCTVEGSGQLEEPSGITAQLLSTDADCDGPNTGSIEVFDPAGGVGDYRFSIDGGVATDTALFTRLSAGTYSLRVSDANNCNSILNDTLREAVIPLFDLTETLEFIELGTSRRIAFFIEGADELRWNTLFLDAIIDSNFNSITIAPTFPGTLTGTAVSTDGCITTDSLRIVVDNPRKVFAPTAFSPNADGINDAFSLASGPGVLAIEDMRIFDRWGGLVYQQQDVTGEWDGQEAASGVYVWRALIVYLDGQQELLSGAVVLLR